MIFSVVFDIALTGDESDLRREVGAEASISNRCACCHELVVARWRNPHALLLNLAQSDELQIARHAERVVAKKTKRVGFVKLIAELEARTVLQHFERHVKRVRPAFQASSDRRTGAGPQRLEI